jgi:hypothetical protein
MYKTGKNVIAKKIFFCLLLSSFLIGGSLRAQTVKIIPVGKAWANNLVNAVIFRKTSLVSYKTTNLLPITTKQET